MNKLAVSRKLFLDEVEILEGKLDQNFNITASNFKDMIDNAMYDVIELLKEEIVSGLYASHPTQEELSKRERKKAREDVATEK